MIVSILIRGVWVFGVVWFATQNVLPAALFFLIAGVFVEDIARGAQ
jgi:hypothetical protein